MIINLYGIFQSLAPKVSLKPTGDCQAQLALKAAAVAGETPGGSRGRRHSKSSRVGRELMKILTKGSKKERREKKSRREKKKRKEKRGRASSSRIKPDPDGSSSPGRTPSSGSYSSSSWEDERSSSEEKDLDPPLRKRSKQSPGSVLKLLLAHARAQLDQSAKVALDPLEAQRITEGVKMGSYFSICIRPSLGNSMRPIRELHHLSTAIDLLRQGNLNLLGDMLASRFMAIHQASVDGNWVAANSHGIVRVGGQFSGHERCLVGDASPCKASRKSCRFRCIRMEQGWPRKRKLEGQEPRWSGRRSALGRKGAWKERKGKEERKATELVGRSGRCQQMERREGWQCGEEAGLSNRPHSLAVPLTCMGRAPGIIPEIVFAEVIKACTSLRSTGCVLCWLLVQGMVPGVRNTGNSSFVALVISLLGAKTQGYPKRKKGAAFPIKEGELYMVKEKFSNLPFQAFRDEDFVQRWYLDAWLFVCLLSLNFLWGAVAGLPPGRWLQSDRMAVESVRAAIQRRCLDDVFLPTSEADWEKELASRMVMEEKKSARVMF